MVRYQDVVDGTAPQDPSGRGVPRFFDRATGEAVDLAVMRPQLAEMLSNGRLDAYPDMAAQLATMYQNGGARPPFWAARAAATAPTTEHAGKSLLELLECLIQIGRALIAPAPRVAGAFIATSRLIP